MTFSKQIGGTIYQVKVYCDQKDDVTFEDTIIRLIQNAAIPHRAEATSEPAEARVIERAIV